MDKATVEVAGRSLLDRVLAAVLTDAGRVVVVSPPRALPSGVLRTSELPTGGGPVAGVAAGLELVQAPLVVVLACDLPFLTAQTVTALVAALDTAEAACADGAALVDADGWRQPLTAAYRTARLRAAVAALEEVQGSPMRAVVAALTMLDVPARSGQSFDCDTWDDVQRARTQAESDPSEDS